MRNPLSSKDETDTSWVETHGWRYYFFDEVVALDVDRLVKRGLYQQVMHSKTPDEVRELLNKYAAARVPRKETIQ